MAGRDVVRDRRRHLRFRVLDEAGARQVEHWFDHPEIRRRLGGRSWIHREVGLIRQRRGERYRGMTTLRSFGWLVDDPDGVPVAYVAGSVYDRWVQPAGPDGSAGVVDDRRCASLMYAVDPLRWRRGFGRAVLEAAIDRPELAEIGVMYCGIDSDNLASQRCARAVGFVATSSEPDGEGTLYFRRERRR